jgi:hypothetical protein
MSKRLSINYEPVGLLDKYYNFQDWTFALHKACIYAGFKSAIPICEQLWTITASVFIADINPHLQNQ